MTNYPYGYCGMPCALCTRFRTNGKSRCPGCSNDGYYTDVCKVHHCCREKQLEHCGRCDTFPCARLGKMGEFSDLKTNHVKERTCKVIASTGLQSWYNEYTERVDLLTVALERYNDGRMKRYLCELFIQKELAVLKDIMRQAELLTGTQKENSKLFKDIVTKVTEIK